MITKAPSVSVAIRVEAVLDERPGGPHVMVIVGGGGGGGDGAPAAGGGRQVTPAA